MQHNCSLIRLPRDAGESCYPIATLSKHVSNESQAHDIWHGMGARQWTHGSTCDGHLDLTPRRTHQLAKLVADTLQQTETVILCERIEEVLDGVVLVDSARVLLQLRDNGRLVLGGQRRGHHDGCELGVSVKDLLERRHCTRGAVERGRLRCRRELVHCEHNWHIIEQLRHLSEDLRALS